MRVAVLTLELRIPGCGSLKEKRRRLKPLLLSLRREFNVSAAELERNDQHQHAVIACAGVANDGRQVERILAGVPRWVETHRPDLEVVDHEVTVL